MQRRHLFRWLYPAVIAAVSVAGTADRADAQFPDPTVNIPIASMSLTPSDLSLVVGQQQTLTATATLSTSSTVMLGGGMPIWNMTTSPGINVSMCGTGAVSFNSQNFKLDAFGAFHEVWSPGSPNTLRVDGSMTLPTATTGATIAATMECVNGAASGSFQASWTGTQYDGTFSFAGGAGQIAVFGLTWTSDNPAVAMVDQAGKITALSEGDAVITATYGSECWRATPDLGNPCRGTVSAMTTVHVVPSGGGGGGGGEEEGCVSLTFMLAPDSASFSDVEVNVFDPGTGELMGTFPIPIGVTQSISAAAFHLRFTVPDGYTLTPAEMMLDVSCGDEVVIPLLFEEVEPPPTVDTLMADAAALNLEQSLGLLRSARSRLLAGNITAACNQLSAFMSQVGAQSGKGLTPSGAADLLASTATVRASLGCR